MAQWGNGAMRGCLASLFLAVCVVFVMTMGGWVVMEGGR